MDKNRSRKHKKTFFLELNLIFQTFQNEQMKYFWWRLIDYTIGALGGGAIVFFINRFACSQCMGQYTPIMMLGVWIGFMLGCNFVFQKAWPINKKQDG